MKDVKAAHVWAGLWVGGLVLSIGGNAALAVMYWLGFIGLYALVCWRLPTYDCPKCLGGDKVSGPVLSLLALIFGGNRYGCRSKRCNGGQRVRWGIVVAQPTRAKWLAEHPRTGERERVGR